MTKTQNGEVVVAQLVEWSLMIPDVSRFDSSHRQNFIEHLFVNMVIINCIEKTKINKKRYGMAHFLKHKMFSD